MMQIRKNQLFKNFSYLSLLQVSNYLFPLITLPYLVAVLGPAKYGLVSFALAFVAYFNVVTDFGFNLSATREISIYRSDQEKISSIFSSVYSVKIVLLLLSFAAFFILIFFIPFFNKDIVLYLIAFGVVIGNTFFPLWFFQGLEKMKYITYFNFVGRFLFTIFIFMLIHNSNDFIIFIGLSSLSSIGISTASLLFILTKFKIKLKLPKKEELLHQINEGKQIFYSNIGISLYTTSNTFILGLLTNNTVVGYYAAADKIRYAVQSIYSPLSQTIYPRLAQLFNRSINEGLNLIKKVSSLVLILGIIAGVFIAFFSNEIVILVLGKQYLPSTDILRIMAFLPLIIALSNLSGIQVMLNIGEKKMFMKTILLAAAINLSLLFILIPVFAGGGAAFSVLFTEMFITTSFLVYLSKRSINIFALKYA